MFGNAPLFLRIAVFLGLLISFAAQADEVGRTAAAHANDKPVPTEAATTPPVRAVNSRTAIYTNANGEPVKGWLSWPAAETTIGMPAMLVIHEWWGLNDNIRQTAERLAAEGYITLAVDLYNGQTGTTPKAAMGLMQGLNDSAEEGRLNLVAAYEYLTTVMGAEKVGVIGWCLGGRWSLQTALRLPEQIDAMVMYYGAVTDDKVQLKTLKMPILGLFADNDPVVPLDTVLAFRKALEELGKPAEVVIYEGAKHGFANPSGLAYNPEAAEDAWNRTTAFLASHLQ